MKTPKIQNYLLIFLGQNGFKKIIFTLLSFSEEYFWKSNGDNHDNQILIFE
jgi:hypothetical protein